jgi:hypothetical protein
VFEREPVPDGRPIIHDVHCVAIRAELTEQAVHQVGIVSEGVSELRVIRRCALAKSRIVRRDGMVAVSQGRDQITEHVRGGREAVQQKHDWSARGARLAVEDVNAIDLDRVIVNRRRHSLDGGV